jgi:hypothetical protein
MKNVKQLGYYCQGRRGAKIKLNNYKLIASLITCHAITAQMIHVQFLYKDFFLRMIV